MYSCWHPEYNNINIQIKYLAKVMTIVINSKYKLCICMCVGFYTEFTEISLLLLRPCYVFYVFHNITYSQIFQYEDIKNKQINTFYTVISNRTIFFICLFFFQMFLTNLSFYLGLYM